MGGNRGFRTTSESFESRTVRGTDGRWGTVMDLSSFLRMQFRELHLVGRHVGLDQDRQRRVLLVHQHNWADWSKFLEDGPLPSEPDVSIMLRRVEEVTHRLVVRAERQTVRPQ